MRAIDIAWLGGLLEGEGSFALRNGSPIITMQSTDPDVVARAATLMGVRSKGGASWKPRGKPTYKRVYAMSVHGVRAIGWMQTLFLFLGERRRAKVREVLAGWCAQSRWPRAPRGRRFMATCHPDRVRYGHGLCHRCYMRRWRANKKA